MTLGLDISGMDDEIIWGHILTSTPLLDALKPYFTRESTGVYIDPTWANVERNEEGEIIHADLVEISIVPVRVWGIPNPRSTMDSVQPCEGCDSSSNLDEDTKD